MSGDARIRGGRAGSYQSRSSAPRVLFHCPGRRGLGHLVRGLNLARELSALDSSASSFFYTEGEAIALCGGEFPHFVEPDRSGSSWPDVVEDFGPDVIVYDTLLPECFPHAELSAAPRSVYVMRKCRPARQQEIFQHPRLQEVDLILIPHTPSEFGYEVPVDLVGKSVFTGPITRAPSSEAKQRLREKYGLRRQEFLLTSTAGGGGFLEETRSFFAAVAKIHRRLARGLDGFRHLVIRGPNFREPLPALEGMTTLEFELEAMSLFAISNLVVAQGGYNTVNEIRLAKAPAVFLPSRRNYDDQEERVRDLEQKGLAAVFVGRSGDAIARGVEAICSSPAWFESVRGRYAADRIEIGNRLAAARILALLA